MRKAVFFISSCDGRGLTSIFSQQVVDMHSLGRCLDIDTYCVSSNQEQNPGLWDFVKKNIPERYIIKYIENDWEYLKNNLVKLISQYDKVIIHCQGFNQLRRLRKLKQKYSHVRIVITIHSYPRRLPQQFLKKYLYGGVFYLLVRQYIDKMIFLSPFAIKGFIGWESLIKQNKIVHIPFCLPTLPVQNLYSPMKENVGERYNIVYLANFSRNKGHERFFASISKFVKNHTNVHVWFFGEGPRRQAVLNLVKKTGLEGKVHCPGRIQRSFIPSILEIADLALVLSKVETFGHAFLEPVLYKCPVVGTRVGCAEYLIQDYMTSMGVDSVESLYDVLEYAYKHQKDFKEKVSAFHEVVTRLYDYNKMTRAYFELYNNV